MDLELTIEKKETLAGIISELKNHQFHHRRLYKIIDQYSADGTLNIPEEVPEVEVDLSGRNFMDLVSTLNTNKAYISKYKNKPDRKEEVEKRRAENQRIEELFKNTEVNDG